MKHLLNNLSELEKNSIREQHSGGMKVMTENFSKLINCKLGDVKTIVEQPTPVNTGSRPRPGVLPNQGNPTQQQQIAKPGTPKTGNPTTATTGNDRIANLANILKKLKFEQRPVLTITSDNKILNGVKFTDYLKTYKITNQEIQQAKQLLNKMGQRVSDAFNKYESDTQKNQQQTMMSQISGSPQS